MSAKLFNIVIVIVIINLVMIEAVETISDLIA